jgi:hypothetical protein
MQPLTTPQVVQAVVVEQRQLHSQLVRQVQQDKAQQVELVNQTVIIGQLVAAVVQAQSVQTAQSHQLLLVVTAEQVQPVHYQDHQ